jgi:putative endopeptidase
LYVAEHFPPEVKARLDEMIRNIKVVFRDRLKELEWMTPATRERALAKFARFESQIGYPEKWKDYSAVEVQRDDYFGNVRRAAIANSRRELAKVGQPVDKREFSLTPQTVNAYFQPTANQIVFLAGILQPPFFDAKADDAINYGAIGAVIGHEITHGFDDQGRRFDADGNLTDWWTPEDEAEFKRRAQRLVDQFNAYEVLPGVFVQGAFEAFQRSLQGKPRPPRIDGFTAEQRFFLSWAQSWRTKFRDSRLKEQVTTGPHAPGFLRATGPLVNLKAFYDAFEIREGDPMWRAPELRAEIW